MDPPEVIIADGLRFQELIAQSRENINRHENRCYILSMKWLNSWKDYTGYELLIKGTEDENFRLGSNEAQTVSQEETRQA